MIKLGIVMDPISSINIKKTAASPCCWKRSAAAMKFTIWK
ncbi:hypothetical protein SODG_000640 [Sodalis praecaptivus]